LDAPAAEDTAPLEERPIGGLGIHLVRTLMDEIEYAREGKQNRLMSTCRSRRWKSWATRSGASPTAITPTAPRWRSRPS
jgi:hypothetical protein